MAHCAQAREELRQLSGQDEGRKLDDILGSVGLAGVADQLKDLRLGGCSFSVWVLLGWVEHQSSAALPSWREWRTSWKTCAWVGVGFMLGVAGLLMVVMLAVMMLGLMLVPFAAMDPPHLTRLAYCRGAAGHASPGSDVYSSRRPLAKCAYADLSLWILAGELLDTPPPGVDEAIAIAKVIQFLKASWGAVRQDPLPVCTGGGQCFGAAWIVCHALCLLPV